MAHLFMSKLQNRLHLSTIQQADQAARYARDNALLAQIAGHLELSDSARIYSSGHYAWATVSLREDLEALLTLAPLWSKTYPEGAAYIKYEATILFAFAGTDGETAYAFEICATEAALPGTCTLEEYTVDVPASTRTAKRLKCDFAAPTPPPPTEVRLMTPTVATEEGAA